MVEDEHNVALEPGRLLKRVLAVHYRFPELERDNARAQHSEPLTAN